MRVGVHRATEQIEPLLARLTTAQERDSAAEQRAVTAGKWAKRLLIGCIPVTIAAVFWGLSGFYYVLWLVPPLALAGLVARIIQAHAQGVDLEDRKIEAPLRVLGILRADIPSAARVNLELDFRDPVKAGRKHRTEKDRFWIFWSTRSITYVHPWLTLRGVLADGTRFQLGLTDTAIVKDKRKRKYTKRRTRTRGTVSIALRFKPSRKVGVGRIAERIKTQPQRRGLALRSVSAGGNRLTCSLTTRHHLVTRGRYGHEDIGGTENKVTGKMLLEGLLWVFDAVGGSRAA